MTTPVAGRVWLVGAGPGDPGLITVRGAECLRQAEVVIYDYLANPRLLELVPPECEKIYVGKKAGAHTLQQDEIDALLVAKCREGKRVVRLKGGDPFVFGRGGEEALALAEAGCAFGVVPGITAGIAAPAYAGIPVTHRGIAATVTFVTGHEDPTKEDSDIDWESLARVGGTLAFYMGVSNLRPITTQLIRHGRPPSTPVALIQWGTWPAQRTLTGTLESIARLAEQENFKPPAVTLVGEVVSLRERLGWFESRPLFGRKIVVTRSRAQAGELSVRLEELGAAVVEFPVIRIVAPDDPAPFERAVAGVASYAWVIFTSVNAVDVFLMRLHAMGRDARAFGPARICAVGPATAARLATFGLRADLMPPKYVAESIVESLRVLGELRGQRFLLPRTDIGRDLLPDALRNLGAIVDDVTAYRTVLESPPGAGDLLKDLQKGRIAAVTFTSSSTVRNFVQIVGASEFRQIAQCVLLASIGPETTKTLAEFTERSIVQSEEYTIEGLVRLLTEELGRHSSSSPAPSETT
jgi:uroporphyrinogen III methyltransferase/synthase